MQLISNLHCVILSDSLSVWVPRTFCSCKFLVRWQILSIATGQASVTRTNHEQPFQTTLLRTYRYNSETNKGEAKILPTSSSEPSLLPTDSTYCHLCGNMHPDLPWRFHNAFRDFSRCNSIVLLHKYTN